MYKTSEYKTFFSLHRFNAILIFFSIFCSDFLYAQNGSVGIGTENPDNSAILHLQSSSKGFLMPAMTQAQRNAIASPAAGLLIYQTDVSPGFYFYNGTSWVSIGTASVYWQPGGNTLTDASATFIGTLNNYPIGIYTNNSERLKIDGNGNIAAGTDYSSEKFNIGGRLALAETSAPSSSVSGYGKLFADTDNNNLYYYSSSGTKSQLSEEFAVFQDVKSSGTDGGTFNSGSWVKRDLNTVSASRGASISLNTGNSQITLKRGVYLINASAPAFDVNFHKTRFIKVSGTGTSELTGSSEFTSNSIEVQTRSHVEGAVEVTSDDAVFELQHRANNSRTTSGLGLAAGFGVSEVYSIITIRKIE